MLLSSHAERDEKYINSACSTPEDKKIIPASQPPEGDYEFAYLLHDVLEGSRAPWTAKGTKHPTASNKRAKRTPPDGIRTQMSMKISLPDSALARRKANPISLRRRSLRLNPSLVEGDDTTGHVLVDIVSHRMDDNHHMNDEGHGGPQPDNQTHLESIGASDVVHVEATSYSNGVKVVRRENTDKGLSKLNHVPVRSHWSKYKGDTKLLSDYYDRISLRFDIDTNASPVKAACTRYLQIGVRLQRHALKRKYFDYRPLYDVPKESPVSSMNDVEWNQLVQHWMEPKMKEVSNKNRVNRAKVQFHPATGSRSYVTHLENLGDKYNGKELGPLDMFKECHLSQHTGLSTPTKLAIAEMEYELSVTTTDGGRKPQSQVAYEVLSRKTSQPTFLQNAGVIHQPFQSRKSKLVAELESEKMAGSELFYLAKINKDQIDQMVAKEKEREEKQAVMSANIEKLLKLMYQ